LDESDPGVTDGASFANLNGTAMVVSEKVHFHEIAVILDAVARPEKPVRSGSDRPICFIKVVQDRGTFKRK
jgi:hypothetical protein